MNVIGRAATAFITADTRRPRITSVPEALHRKLKVRAADAGQTPSDYLLAELERVAARPTRDEMLIRRHRRKRVTLKTPAAVLSLRAGGKTRDCLLTALGSAWVNGGILTLGFRCR